jgi:hypothetical protein
MSDWNTLADLLAPMFSVCFFRNIEVGQARFYSSRKTILIRFDLPEDFTDCPDFLRGEDEDTEKPFQCPAWNTWEQFLKSLKTYPLIP